MNERKFGSYEREKKYVIQYCLDWYFRSIWHKNLFVIKNSLLSLLQCNTSSSGLDDTTKHAG